jgi:hypothetical protein
VIDDDSRLAWRRSSRCNTATCVEVADAGVSVMIRDTKDLNGPTIAIMQSDWNSFLAGVRGGRFDHK